MKRELKHVLDLGYELTKINNERIYNSEHLLLGILTSNNQEAQFLNKLGITTSKVYDYIKRIYKEETKMYKNQKLQVSDLVMKVINNDNTVKEALNRIVVSEGMTNYIVSCINPNAVFEIAQYCESNIYTSSLQKETFSHRNNNLLNLETLLKNKVIGQDEAIESVAKIIKRRSVGISSANKPIGSVLFVGTTGTGKTELAKALAEIVFNGNIIRLDMSEYQEKVAITKLIGSAPGYIGYQEGGHLTEAIKKNPHSVVLFDEIEKAHPDIYNVLLQILDEGRLTDNKGITVDFTNTLIVLTSNVGAENSRTKEEYKIALQRIFKPEFLNRLSDIVVFNRLDNDVLINIAEKELSLLLDNLRKQKNILISVDKSVIPFMMKKYNLNIQYGAREVKRVVVDKIADKISDAILIGKLSSGRTVQITIVNSELYIKQ